jgi:polysaccharide biosynthesis/export protein
MSWPCLTPKDRERPQPEVNPMEYFRRCSLSMAFGTIFWLGCSAGTLGRSHIPPPVAVPQTDNPAGTAADSAPVAPQQLVQAGPPEKPTRRSQRLEQEVKRLRADLSKSESARATLAKRVETLQKDLHDQSASKPSTEATTAKAGDDYRIRAGDVLEIVVWKNQDLSRTVSVKPEGRISLPLLNEVDAAGLTPLQLRDRLIGLLSAYIPNPEVFVLVSQVRSFNVSVIGQVNHPGRYELQSRTTVLEALALAGGLSDFASRGGISVLRSEGSDETQSMPFDYRKAVSGDGSANFQLRPGDIIVVP